MQENSRIISTVMSSWTDDALIGEKDRVLVPIHIRAIGTTPKIAEAGLRV